MVPDSEQAQTSRQVVIDLLRRAAEAGDKALLAECGTTAAGGNDADIVHLAALESTLANDVLRRVCEAMKLDFEATTERAALIEIDGNLPRLAAEKEAVAQGIKARIGWDPPPVFLKALFRRGLLNEMAKLRKVELKNWEESE